MKHSHYFIPAGKFDKLDLYRIAEQLGIENHAQFHAWKKITCAGKRGSKSTIQDIQEAIDSLQRWIEMLEENENVE